MQARYSGVNQAFHWLTVLLVMAILPVAWIMISLGKGAPTKAAWITTHKTLGILILGVTVLRLLWRIVDRPPLMPAILGRASRIGAHIVQGLLFLALLVMPVSGYLMSAFDGKRIDLFGRWPLPMLVAKNDAYAGIAFNVHDYTQWALYGLVVLHVCGAAFHVIFGRSGVLGRILPAGALEPR